jgi:hypothetical protein
MPVVSLLDHGVGFLQIEASRQRGLVAKEEGDAGFREGKPMQGVQALTRARAANLLPAEFLQGAHARGGQLLRAQRMQISKWERDGAISNSVVGVGRERRLAVGAAEPCQAMPLSVGSAWQAGPSHSRNCRGRSRPLPAVARKAPARTPCAEGMWRHTAARGAQAHLGKPNAQGEQHPDHVHFAWPRRAKVKVGFKAEWYATAHSHRSRPPTPWGEGRVSPRFATSPPHGARGHRLRVSTQRVG